MGPYYYWLASDLSQRERLRRANEARLTAWAEAWNRLAADLQAGRAALAGLAARLQRMRREAATLRELRALDDRILRDIGLSRAEIREAVRNPRPRRPAPRLAVVAGAARPANDPCCDRDRSAA